MIKSKWMACVVLLSSAFACGVLAQSIVVQPPLNTFALRSDLAGKHPRLYFTQADTAAIRARAKGPCKWFYDKAKRDFGGYVSQRTPDAPGTWKDYLFGFWGQFTMDMIYLVEGDTACANAAKSWALYYAGRTDWLADDLIPMDITTGMALTYDILYNILSPAERAALQAGLKRSIDTMMIHFFQGEYWTNDYQNNHMHNRIHGLGHAAFALYGDNPSINVQTAADLAMGCFNQLVQWLPDDGSTHEGAGYWDYGYHWVARTAELVKFVTGTDPAAGRPHFSTDYLYRLYMCTPGLKNTFCIGDAEEGAPANADAWVPAMVKARDGAADSIFHRLMKEQAGGFYQHTMWNVLWYDGGLAAVRYDTLPLYRFWPDLEMFSIRGSWADTATAFVFKCGPPGGHHMRQLRGAEYVNVAHDHPDQNHFLLFSNGRMLAQDDGYPTDHKYTRNHNTIVIDTLGQPRDGDGWYQPYDYNLCGSLDDVMLTGSSACAAGNASRLYAGATRFVRHVAFVEGGYVVSIDELTGSGTGMHDFEWRLHKAGTWSAGQPGQFFVADSGNMRLDIRFLEPVAASLQSAFLPAQSTGRPCLAARVRATSTRFTAVLVPQHNGQPALSSALLSAVGAAAVQVQGSGFDDVFAIKTVTGAFTAGALVSDASHALVRRQAGAVTFAMMTRGTSLAAGGRTLLRAAAASNLSWRGDSSVVMVEAEPAYKAGGGADTVMVGGLMPSRNYSVIIDGRAAGSAPANSSGEARVPVNLQKRLSIRLAQGSGVERSGADAARGLLLSVRQTAGGMEFIIGDRRADARVLEVFDLRGRLIRAWDNAASGMAQGRVFWSGAGKDGGGAPAGVYIARLTVGDAARALPFIMVK